MTPLHAIASWALATSPWSPAAWRVTVNIGREPSTEMPPLWGASGARLAFPLEILVESGRVEQPETERDFVGGTAMRFFPLEDPTYVGSRGEEIVKLGDEAGWRISLPRGAKGEAGTLRFWIDVEPSPSLDGQVAAIRNDVTLPAERLYFVANCWREDELELGLRRFRPIQAAAREAQGILDAQLSHETGDRRLDGTNPIDTALASLDMAGLVKDRDEKVRQLREAERVLPSPAVSQLSRGTWPGSTDKLVIAPGTIGVKRKAGFFAVEDYHILGSWTATPI